MSALGKKLRQGEGYAMFQCPGCGDSHSVTTGPGGWTFNGDGDRPTFQPSVHVTSGHYVARRHPNSVAFQKGAHSCWCTYNAEHPDDPAPFKCRVCHSFVTDGRIQFLSDCTHALAGQTVDLPDYPLKDA